MHRRLAAIFAAEVVGFSRPAGEDEAGTLVALKAQLEELIAPRVAEHEGRIVRLAGDHVLAEFPDAVEAMRCAVEVQRVKARRNVLMPHGRRIQLRIGVNLGDVTCEGDGIYGDGVNVAARLKELAEPGGICIASTVHLQVKGRFDVGYRDLGDQEVEDIEYPVHAYSVLLDGAPPPPPEPNRRRPWPPAVQFLSMLLASLVVIAGGYIGWLRL